MECGSAVNRVPSAAHSTGSTLPFPLRSDGRESRRERGHQVLGISVEAILVTQISPVTPPAANVLGHRVLDVAHPSQVSREIGLGSVLIASASCPGKLTDLPFVPSSLGPLGS